jgi:hypothetical protein
MVQTPKIVVKTVACLGGSNVRYHVLVVAEFSFVSLCPVRAFLHVRLEKGDRVQFAEQIVPYTYSCTR